MLDVDATVVSGVLVADPYWFCLVCRLISLVVIASSWCTHIFMGCGTGWAMGVVWGKGAVATNPFIGNGF